MKTESFQAVAHTGTPIDGGRNTLNGFQSLSLRRGEVAFFASNSGSDSPGAIYHTRAGLLTLCVEDGASLGAPFDGET